jgi:hypothetical protein
MLNATLVLPLQPVFSIAGLRIYPDLEHWGPTIMDDMSYYQMRAETEVELARQSGDPRAVQAHYDLSSAYLELIWGVVDHVGRASGD